MIMLVGRDLGEPERFRAVIRRALMLALGMLNPLASSGSLSAMPR